jgi:hypothetical protein
MGSNPFSGYATFVHAPVLSAQCWQASSRHIGPNRRHNESMATPSKRPSLKLVGSSSRHVKLLQLNIELQDVRPKVWRSVMVKSSVRLPKLNMILLKAMGWKGYHLHEFEFADGRYGDIDMEFPDDELLDQTTVTLSKALGYSESFTWIYDFGDEWVHNIKVERTENIPADIAPNLPVCLAGAGACPPEDVGGTHGYEEFLEAIAKPDHPEHENMKTWIGRPFDPASFNTREVQDRLDGIKM